MARTSERRKGRELGIAKSKRHHCRSRPPGWEERRRPGLVCLRLPRLKIKGSGKRHTIRTISGVSKPDSASRVPTSALLQSAYRDGKGIGLTARLRFLGSLEARWGGILLCFVPRVSKFQVALIPPSQRGMHESTCYRFGAYLYRLGGCTFTPTRGVVSASTTGFAFRQRLKL